MVTTRFSCDSYVVSLSPQNGGMEYIKKEEPDIFTVQETKCADAELPKVCMVVQCLSLTVRYGMWDYEDTHHCNVCQM